MASGKTATAKAMGKIFQSGFVDLDAEIEIDEVNQSLKYSRIMGKIILGV